MKIRLKKRWLFGVGQFGFDARIEKVEPLMQNNFPDVRAPKALKGKKQIVLDQKGVSLFIKGLEGTGVISLSWNEVETVAKALKGRKEDLKKSVKKKIVKKK